MGSLSGRGSQGMEEDLYHPRHVVAGLARIEGVGHEDLKAALQAGTGSKLRLPDEALVRLIRRSRVNGDEVVERLVCRTLLDRLLWWAWRTYSTLSPEDRKDLACGTMETIIKAIVKTNGIDFWEITFARNRKRAAADVYEQYFLERSRNDHEEYDINHHAEDDAGVEAEEIAQVALSEARASRVLSPEEMRYFHPLFLSGIPLRSPRASTDLVRMLGKPEGTLREIKTAIKKKLKNAWETRT